MVELSGELWSEDLTQIQREANRKLQLCALSRQSSAETKRVEEIQNLRIGSISIMQHDGEYGKAICAGCTLTLMNNMHLTGCQHAINLMLRWKVEVELLCFVFTVGQFQDSKFAVQLDAMPVVEDLEPCIWSKSFVGCVV